MDFETPPPPNPPPDSEPTSPTPPTDSPRRGSARARREQRRRAQATPRPAPGARQIQVPQGIKLPNGVRLPSGGRLLLGLGAAVAFVVLLVVVLGRLRNTTAETPPNALWLGTEWTYETHTDEEIAALVKKLRDRQIGTVYAYVTYLQFNGTWRNEDKFDNVKTFVQQFKKAYPEGKLGGLIGVPVSDATHAPRLSDVTLQQQVADLSKRLIDEFKFHGIFLDAEPVWDGDQDFLALLRAVRGAVGISVQITAAIPPDWSPAGATIAVPPLIEPGTEWKKEYKQSVALLVDHMAIMAYLSSLTTTSDYAQWVAYQVKVYAQAVAELDTNIDLLIGIPTFDAEPPGHDPAIENIDTAVDGIRLGLQQAGDAARYVTGLAIYADWTTDDDEWAQWQHAWLDK